MLAGPRRDSWELLASWRRRTFPAVAQPQLQRRRVRRADSAVDEIQNAYSVINRRDDALVALARVHQIPFVAFGPLGSAYMRGLAVDHRCSCACRER
jgi:aryl-alcohol dehydrogenase-like predicted oxidoreductase